jgi:hypothetical protein
MEVFLHRVTGRLVIEVSRHRNGLIFKGRIPNYIGPSTTENETNTDTKNFKATPCSGITKVSTLTLRSLTREAMYV